MALGPQSEQQVTYKSESFLIGAAKRFAKHKLAMFGVVILLVFCTTAIFAEQFSTHSITRQNLRNRFAPPTRKVIAPTGVSVSGTTVVSAVNNGQIFANNVTTNIPMWYHHIHESISLSPVTNQDAAYLAAANGTILSYNINTGVQQWEYQAGSNLLNMWATERGLFLLHDTSKVTKLHLDGSLQFTTDIGTPLHTNVTGRLGQPLVMSTAGELYVLDTQGRSSLLHTFSVSPDFIAAVDNQTLFVYDKGVLTSFDVVEKTGTSFTGLPTSDKKPGTMIAFLSSVLVNFEQGTGFSYNIADSQLVWESNLESSVVRFAFDGRQIHSIMDNGRLLIVNPRTGGITSSRMAQGYSDRHILGTDELGRDVFSRLIAGGRISLSLGLTVALISVCIGSIVGACAGYFGGFVDHILMRFVDFMMAIPSLPLLMIVSYLLGPSYRTMVVVLVMFGWIGISRIVRSQTLSLKQQEFILASRAIGASTPRIIFRHILPNTVGPIIVAATLSVGSAILSESQLSYLSLGIQPPTPSWGNMLMLARNYLTDAPWLAVWPGLLIFLTLLSINFIGDGLRDALDPKLKNRN